MSEHPFWSVLKVTLATSVLVVTSLFVLIVASVLASVLIHSSGPKTVEIVRYVTAPSSSTASPPHSSTRPTP